MPDQDRETAPREMSFRASLLLLLALTLAAWTPTVRTNAWTADDPEVVLQSPAVNGSLPLSAAFTQDYTYHVGASGQWRPFAAITLRADHAIYGPSSSRGWHFSNLLIHLATVVLLADLARKALARIPIYGLCLYAIHPTLADSVAWVSGRPSLLCVLLGVMGGHLLFNAMRAQRSGLMAPIAAMAAITAPLLAKEDGCLFALPLLLLTWKVSPRQTLRVGLGVLAGVLTWFALRHFALGAAFPAATQPLLAEAPLYERIGLSLKVIAEAARLFVTPVGRPPSYELESMPTWTMTALILSVTALSLWLAHRAKPIPRLAWALPLAALAPFLHLVPLGEAFAPRFAHISTLFLIPLADDLLRRLTSPLPVAILLTLGGTSWNGTRDYRDAEAYWLASLHHAPSSPVAWNALGLARADSARHEEAISAYKAAIAQDSSHSKAWSNLARSLLEIGRQEEAVQALQAAVRSGPRNPIAHTNWGLHLERIGEHRQARESFIKATELRPGMPQAWAGLARTERRLGREPEAKRAEQRLRSLGINPRN